jgi:Undecaprenyl-phosphate galactose phosphotransferase WbaP
VGPSKLSGATENGFSPLAAASPQIGFRGELVSRSTKIARQLVEQVALLCADAAALSLAFIIAVDLKKLASMATAPQVLSVWMERAVPSHTVAFVSTTCLLFYWFWERGHYTKRLPFWDELGGLLRILSIGVVTEAVLLVMLSPARIDRMMFVSTWAVAFILVPLGRLGIKRVLLWVGLWRRPVIVIGSGEHARSAIAALCDEPLMGYHIRWIGKFEGDESISRPIVIAGSNLPVIELGSNPKRTLHNLGSPQIIVAVDNLAHQEQLIQDLGIRFKDIHVIPSIRGLPFQGMEALRFFRHEVLLLRAHNNLARTGPQFIKRTFDIIAASCLLTLFFPLLAWISWKIWREDGGPLLFVQPRIGRNGQRFSFYKFRSMVQDADFMLEEWKTRNPARWREYEQGNFKLRDDPRITVAGKWLRSTSMDELPQLLNVLRGNMSLVGPRPFLERESAFYGESVRLYYEVRPGITGLWQISGRSDTQFADRVALDSWYIRNWSLWIDIVVLLKTVRVVFGRSGAY